MYDELAAWWPLLDDPADYAEEAGVYGDLLAGACDGAIESLLELGCGGGNNALHMKRRFGRLVLSDLSPGMLEVSRALNPECEHHLGDMRTLRLNRTFDAVFVHDAVCYMTTEDDLRRAIETAWIHCRAGGAALLAPDYVRENFRPGATSGGCDERGEPGGGECPRGLRYLEWVWDPGSVRHAVPGRLRLPAQGTRRRRAHRAGSPRRRAVPARPLAVAAGRRSASRRAACPWSSRTWSRGATRCSPAAGRGDLIRR